MFATRIVLVGFCTLGALSAGIALPAAQQTATPGPAPSTPTFRAASRDLVVLPVTLRDGSDKLVAGLSVDRFVVFDEDRRQPISLFSNEDVPVSVAVVIDDSGSMGRRMPEVMAATLHFARSSNPDDQVFVIEFNDRVRDALGGRPVTANNTSELEGALRSLVPQGRTALYDGLHTGMDRLERSSLSRRVLLLISDGGDNASGSDLKSVVERARVSNVSIYPLGVFSPDDPDANADVLKTLANETGGERFLPRSAGPLMQAIEQIAREIRSGYTIAFEPPMRDGRYHRVRVEVTGPNSRDYRIRTRPGYVAGTR